MILPNDPDSLKQISPGRILGIDYGKKRIGLSLSDPFQMLASTLRTLFSKNRQNLVQELAAIVREHNVTAVVFGKPLHMSGDESAMAKEVVELAELLAAAAPVPIFLWDERWTTTSAEKLLIETGQSPSKSRSRIDQVAAAFLLQGFLDRLSYIKKSGSATNPPA